MKKRPSPLLDDMTRMAKGAASAMDDVRGDMQSRWRRRNPSAMAQAMKENMPPRASRAMERMAGGLAERMGRNQAAQSAPAPAQDSVSREEFEAALPENPEVTQACPVLLQNIIAMDKINRQKGWKKRKRQAEGKDG